MKNKSNNIVFIKVQDWNILKPEYIENLLYNKKLNKYKNKVYILINYWNKLPHNIYNKVILNILRQRAVENYLISICISPEIKEIIQCGNNKTVQRVEKNPDNTYGLDIKRMSKGPEALWKNSKMANLKDYRSYYEYLIDFCNK